jgi:hypothetical protein
MRNQTTKPDYGPAGWGALLAALLIGWRVWTWQWPDTPAVVAGWWTLLAAVGGAIATYGVLKALGAVGRAFGRGWRQGA